MVLSSTEEGAGMSKGKRSKRANEGRRRVVMELLAGAGIVITYGDRILSLIERLWSPRPAPVLPSVVITPAPAVARVAAATGTIVGRSTVTGAGSVVITPGTGLLVVGLQAAEPSA
jgi:hypothetical protein